MPLYRFFRQTAEADAETRRVAAKLQAAAPSAAPWDLDLEVVFYVQFNDGVTLKSLESGGESSCTHCRDGSGV